MLLHNAQFNSSSSADSVILCNFMGNFIALQNYIRKEEKKKKTSLNLTSGWMDGWIAARPRHFAWAHKCLW